MSFHPVNTQVTKAFELIRRGQREKAVAIIAAEGYQDPENQVCLIEQFIQFQDDTISKELRQEHVRPHLPRRRNYRRKR